MGQGLGHYSQTDDRSERDHDEAKFNEGFTLSGASTTASGPGALLRGGSFLGGPIAGPLTVFGTFAPSRSEDFVGFRCAR
jgi:formylglycine-generating enzyme required for sulfatase activity